MENIFEAKLVAQNPPTLEIGDWRLEIDPLTINHLPLTINHSFPLLIRPEAARLTTNQTDEPNLINGRLTQHSFRGRYQLITVQTSHQPPATLKFELETAVTLPAIGQTIQLAIDPHGIIPLESG
jgi:hypothetical protein